MLNVSETERGGRIFPFSEPGCADKNFRCTEIDRFTDFGAFYEGTWVGAFSELLAVVQRRMLSTIRWG